MLEDSWLQGQTMTTLQRESGNERRMLREDVSEEDV